MLHVEIVDIKVVTMPPVEFYLKWNILHEIKFKNLSNQDMGIGHCMEHDNAEGMII